MLLAVITCKGPTLCQNSQCQPMCHGMIEAVVLPTLCQLQAQRVCATEVPQQWHMIGTMVAA
jgi:hypothetical protein